MAVNAQLTRHRDAHPTHPAHKWIKLVLNILLTKPILKTVHRGLPQPTCRFNNERSKPHVSDGGVVELFVCFRAAIISAATSSRRGDDDDDVDDDNDDIVDVDDNDDDDDDDVM